MHFLNRIFPLFESFDDYTGRDFRADLVAGLTVGVMLVPQGMAYAFLAGVPPIYGLYSGILPLIVYALMGTSRQLSIGPVAVSALLVLAGVSQVAEPMTEEYISLVIALGLLIGVLQMLLGFIRMGFLVNFLSHPVVAGFTTAAAVIIAVSQLGDLFGIKVPRLHHAYETVHYIIEHIGETNWLATVLCLGSILIILLLKRLSKALPGALIVIVVSILLTWAFGLEKYDLAIVRDVPKGFPAFSFPTINGEVIQKLLPTVLTVTIIGIVESLGIAKVLEAKHQNYVVQPNKELLALGVAKIVGAFSLAIPTSGSFSRSAVNNDSGARSGLSSIITAILIIITLFFLTPLFYFLPKAVLAAIILLAVRNLFEIKEARYLYKTDKRDFLMMMATLISTLILGIEFGVLIGVLLSVIEVLYRSSRPHVAVLGKMPGTTYYRNINRFEEAEEAEDALIVRFDNQLYFGNAAYFKDTIRSLIKGREGKVKSLFLDAQSMHSIDSSGLHALEEVYVFLQRKGIDLYLCSAIGPVRDHLTKVGFMDKIGREKHFFYLHDAIKQYTTVLKENK